MLAQSREPVAGSAALNPEMFPWRAWGSKAANGTLANRPVSFRLSQACSTTKTLKEYRTKEITSDCRWGRVRQRIAARNISAARASKRSSIIRRTQVRTVTAIAARRFGNFITKDFRRIFGSAHDDSAERLGALAQSTIEYLDRSDALYHNFEHTLQVTMVGRDILQGMALAHRIEHSDYSHLIVACLLHDIGYMRGVLSGDTETEFVVDGSGNTIKLPRGASDAALTAYHVDRSKIFALERLKNSPFVDAVRVAAAIEMTRFPVPSDRIADDGLEPKLVQAADFIGQLGDPMYLRKANALYYEFEEIGKNRQLGYSSPADIIDKYPAFFWDSVSIHLEAGMKYLNMTVSGRQWIANLHHHILCAERGRRLLGPQL
jgi:hypothetical protein